MSKYIGSRIVPKHCGAWDKSEEYEVLSLVLCASTGDSYISRKAVPSGIDISDTEYWALSSEYSSQLATVQKRTTALQKETDTLAAQIAENVSASTDDDADYSAEVVDARVGADGKTYGSLGESVRGQVDGLSGEQVSHYRRTKQLINWREGVKSTLYIYNSGTIASMSSVTSYVFPIELDGSYITVTKTVESNRFGFCGFSEFPVVGSTPLFYSSNATAATKYTVKSDSEAKYLLVFLSNSIEEEPYPPEEAAAGLMVEYGKCFTGYAPYYELDTSDAEEQIAMTDRRLDSYTDRTANDFDKFQEAEIRNFYVDSTHTVTKSSTLNSRIYRVEATEGKGAGFFYYGTALLENSGSISVQLFDHIPDVGDTAGAVFSTSWNTSRMRGYVLDIPESSYLMISLSTSYTDAEWDDLIDNLYVTFVDAATAGAIYGTFPDEYVPYRTVKCNADSIYTKEEVDALLEKKSDSESAYTKDETDAFLERKVDKEDGMGLSANSFSDSEKAKLAALSDAGTEEDISDTVRFIAVNQYSIGDNLAADAAVTLGDGWTESDGVYTHASGYTSPLELSVGADTARVYAVSFTIAGNTEDRLTISLGGSYGVDPYNGQASAVVALKSGEAEGSLVFTPASSFTGSISDVVCAAINFTGTDLTNSLARNVSQSLPSDNVLGFWNNNQGYLALSSAVNVTRTIAIGNNALKTLLYGNRNIGIGTFAMAYLEQGERNIAIGADCMWMTKEAYDAIAIGKATMGGNNAKVTGSIAIGAGALNGEDDSETEDNIGIGRTAGSHMSGNKNVFVGYRAGYFNYDATGNVAVGASCLQGGTSKHLGDYNAALGYGCSCEGKSGTVLLGKWAAATADNQAVLGGDNITQTVLKGDLVVRATDGTYKQIVFNADGSVSWETVTI